MSLSLTPGVHAVVGWIVLVPLLLALRSARGLAHAFGLAFVAGLVFWTLHVRWIGSLDGVNAANLGLSLAALAAVFASFGVFAHLARDAPASLRWAVFGAAWVMSEYLRLHLGFAAMPWGSLAYSQIDLVPMAQVAALAGIYGVGFVVVTLAAAGATALDCALRRQRPSPVEQWQIVAPLAGVAVVFAWGLARPEPAPSGEFRLAFVQAGVYDRAAKPDTSRREVLDRYREWTELAAAEDPALIVWPASALPGSIPFDTGLTRWVERLARDVERPLLVGSSGQPKSSPSQRERPTANSAFLIDARGEWIDHYDKIRLVPFNEYVPHRELANWPSWVGGGNVDARAGERRTVFELGEARFAVLICWENLFPGDFREQVAEDVDFVVSMTNEAFTPDRGARDQMLTMNRFRAIEAGIPIVRVATTGVSMAIDRQGRAVTTITDASGDPFDAIGQRVTTVSLGSRPTLYARLGDWLPASSGLGIVGATAAGFASRRRAARVADTDRS